MRRNRQRQCVVVASVLVMFFSSGLSRAQDTDSVLRNQLVLPELIHKVLARNLEHVAARKQGESASFEYQVISYPENERSNSYGISTELSAYHHSDILSRRDGVDDVVYGALERARYVWHEHDDAHTSCRQQRRADHRAARAIADDARAGAGFGSICTTS